MPEGRRPVQVCSRCVMDTSDPAITFDADGVCSHCRDFEREAPLKWFPGPEGERKWNEILKGIRFAGKGAEYDCIIGLSGGVDSSYLAIKTLEWGLRPLVVHVDAGWNSELAVSNIEKIVKFCNFDLHTHVVDWEDMRDLQLAYLKAGVANQDVPQDHAFFASLYHFSTRNRIRYVLSGGNMATEGIFPHAWQGSAMDAINLRAIHRQFGTRPLRSYSTISFFEYYLWYPFVKKMRTVRPLNYMPYDKRGAIQELAEKTGWRPYGRKHGESLFTKLFQNYYLPEKFGYDKRKPHLSSLIVSGQMTRAEAVTELSQPLYDPQELEIDIAYFCKKLRITRDQFNELMSVESHDYRDFPSWERRYRALSRVRSMVERALGRRVQGYG